MRIVLLAFGSRGDIQPFLALASKLKDKEHTVTFAAPEVFRSMVEENQLKFTPLAGDPEEISRLLNSAGENLFQMARKLWRYALQVENEIVLSASLAIQDADLLIHGFAFTDIGHQLATLRGIPDVSIQMFPSFAPTRSLPAVGHPTNMPGSINYFGHWFNAQIFRFIALIGKAFLNDEVKKLLPRSNPQPFELGCDQPPTPLLFAISPSVLGNPEEWRNRSIFTPGYFFLDEPDYDPPKELKRFLEEGDPPICVTFGSMINQDSPRVIKSILAASDQLKLRVILISGWANLPDDHSYENVYLIKAIPHSFIFPKCSTIIHHGGAGTTAAAARSGKPQIIIPHIGDQPFWSDRMYSLGVSSPPLKMKKIDSNMMVEALKFTTDPKIIAKAFELGQKIASDDGLRSAIEIMEKHYQDFKSQALELDLSHRDLES